MNFLKKLLISGILSLSLFAAVPASAQISATNTLTGANSTNLNTITTTNTLNTAFPSNLFSFTRFATQFRDTRVLLVRQPFVTLTTNGDFFATNQFFMNNPFFLSNTVPNTVFAQRVIFVDMSNPASTIMIRNFNTGTGTIRTAVIGVDDTFFTDLATSFDQGQNTTISVDTGNNTISMNTTVGTVSTGNVSINMQ